MTAFTTLEQLWPLAAAVAAALTLLYLLEPRRREIAVPFGALWRTVLARVEARRIGRRWRRLLSWLAMMVIAALIVAALGEEPLGLRAFSERLRPAPRHTVVLVDVSASMAARDGDRGDALLPRSRLDEARAAIAAVLDDALPEERFLVVAVAMTPRTLGPWTSERRALDAALQPLSPSDAGLDLARGLLAADSALHGRSDGRVVVVTDGGPSATALPPVATPVHYRLVGPARVLALPARVSEREAVGDGGSGDGAVGDGLAVDDGPAVDNGPAVDHGLAVDNGLAGDNVAVERVGVRANPGDPSRGVVQARLRNDRALPSQVRVELCARAEGQTAADFANAAAVIEERTVEIAARTSAQVLFSDVALVGGRFAVRVRPAEGERFADVAAYDDTGFAVAARRRKISVLLVSPGNLFLEAALVANDQLEVRRLAPAAYQPSTWARAQRLQHGVDVVVLDQVAAAAPDRTPALRLDLKAHADAAPGDAEARAAGELMVANERHPVARGLSLQDGNIDRLRPLQVPAGATAIIAERGGAVVAIARDDGVRRVDVGLDLLETDLGGRFVLPLLVGNAIDWLAGAEEPIVAALDLGLPWAIAMPVGAVRWTYHEPGRAPAPARTSDDALLGSSEVAGVHVWQTETGDVLARPSRLSAEEAPFAVAARAPLWAPRPASAHAEAPRAPLAAWTALLALAAALLVLEWWLYQRRRTV